MAPADRGQASPAAISAAICTNVRTPLPVPPFGV